MRVTTALLAGACLLACATGATAQTVAPRRVVAFGDSYVDSGNVFRILGQPFPTVYPTGRFSGGTNFVDSLERLFNAPQVNFGIGGAFTGPGNSGFANISGPGIPGFGFEIDRFFAGGGGPFPVVTPSFAADDLVAISIGGNDARFYQFNGGTVAGAPARAAISVREATAGLDRLYGAGARNFAVLAGNVGDLPEVRGTPIAAVGSAFSNAFNAGLQAPLAGYAAGGAFVHYLDLGLVGARIRDNPGAYGLVSAGACPVACVGNTALQDQYLFYVDQVHLTSAGFAIVAEYFQRMIQAPGLLGAASDIGLSTSQSLARTMSGRNDLAGAGDAERPISLFLIGTADRHDARAASTSLPYDYDGTGVAGGVEYNPGTGIFAGLIASYTGPQAKFARTDAKVSADAYQLGAYAAFNLAGLSVSGTAGVGRFDLESFREGVVDRLNGNTKGTTLSAGAEASYLVDVSPAFNIGPVVKVDYARARIRGYTETGDEALALTVGRQRVSALVGQAGLEAHGKLAAGGLGIEPYASATVAKTLDGNGQDISFAIASAPTIVNRLTIGDTDKDVYGVIEAGATVDLGARVSAQVQVLGTIEQPGGNDYGGFAGLKFKF